MTWFKKKCKRCGKKEGMIIIMSNGYCNRCDAIMFGTVNDMGITIQEGMMGRMMK